MNKQLIFEDAVVAYNTAINAIKRMGLMLEEVSNFEYSSDLNLAQFDCVLQYALIVQAIADGEVDGLEASFIELITKRGDILVAVNNKFEMDFSWSNFEFLNENKAYVLIKEMIPICIELSSNLIDSIAMVDAVTTSCDYCAIIESSINTILECFAKIDGVNLDGESDVGKDCLKRVFLDPYKKVKKEFEIKALEL